MPSNNSDLFKYMGLAVQIMVSLTLFTYIGYKLDAYFNWPHICTIILPLLFLFILFYKIIKDTNRKS